MQTLVELTDCVDNQSNRILTISFIYNLSDTDDITLVVADRHRENYVCLVSSLQIDFAVKARILVSVFDVHNVFSLSNVPCYSNAERNDKFFGFGKANSVV